MLEALPKLSDKALLAIYRAAKVRPSLRAIFADPKSMITLRREVMRRGLAPGCFFISKGGRTWKGSTPRY